VAAIHCNPKSGFWRISFRFGGKQYQKSLKTDDEKKAQGWKAQIEENLHDLERGRRVLPATADLWAFIRSGGKLEAEPAVAEALTLEKLFARYEEQMPAGTMEANSRATCRLHQNHLLRILGARRPRR
jgi:hypothetical protein